MEAAGTTSAAAGRDVVLPMDKIKGLKEKVDALIRSLQGSQQRQGNAIMDRGLEQALLWDGFDERTNAHTDPSLAKKQMLELFHDAVGKLDEVGRKSSELVSAMNKYGDPAIVPAEVPYSFAEIPASTVSILPPDVQASRQALLQSGVRV